jgi:hypothetical protein
MPLLGPAEKDELEAMILAALAERWADQGPEGLLAPGVCVVVDAGGASIATRIGDRVLAAVEIRTLFTALCHLSSDGPGSMPRDSLGTLAAEASGALAAQVNRLVAD